MGEAAKRVGLLRVVIDLGGRRLKTAAIAAAFGLSPSAVTTRLNALVSEGLLDLRTSEGGQRKHWAITDAGRAVAEAGVQVEEQPVIDKPKPSPSLTSLVQRILNESDAPRSPADIRRVLRGMDDPEIHRRVRGSAVHVRLAILMQRGFVTRSGNRYSATRTAPPPGGHGAGPGTGEGEDTHG